MAEHQSTFDKFFTSEKQYLPFPPEIARDVVGQIHANLSTKMEFPAFFVVPCFGQESEMCEALRCALSGFQKKGAILPLVELCLSSRDVTTDWTKWQGPDLTFKCFAIDTRSVESFKDRVKKSLWPVWVLSSLSDEDRGAIENDSATKNKLFSTLISALSRPSPNDANLCRRQRELRLHGFFSPLPKLSNKDINVFSYDHGGGHFYRYRFSRLKLASHSAELRDYLAALPLDCPNHFFKEGPRISAQDWEFGIKCEITPDHQICALARQALIEPRYKGAHDNVEVHCIENDPATVAVEIPVWLEPGELNQFSSLFSRKEALTGHIDILRCVEGKIEIWDYKPNAADESTAALQVLLYAMALAIRTSLPLTMFRCGYFDSDNAFVFDPSQASSMIDESTASISSC